MINPHVHGLTRHVQIDVADHLPCHLGVRCGFLLSDEHNVLCVCSLIPLFRSMCACAPESVNVRVVGYSVRSRSAKFVKIGNW